MKHDFTEDDLRQALRHTAYMDDGLRINIPAWVEDNDEVDTEQVDVFRAILDALPDTVADEWEPCTFGEVQVGDRLRIDWECGDRHEGEVIGKDARGLRIQSSLYLKSDSATLYRIPAPVQHPDPAEHHLIVVSGLTWYDVKEPFIALAQFGAYVSHSEEVGQGQIIPRDITDWFLAEATPAGDA